MWSLPPFDVPYMAYGSATYSLQYAVDIFPQYTARDIAEPYRCVIDGREYVLTVPIAFDVAVESAIVRCENLYNGSFEVLGAQRFLAALKTLDFPFMPTNLSFSPDGAMARFDFCGREFVIDCDYEDIDVLFVSAHVDDVLVVKECTPENLLEALESYR